MTVVAVETLAPAPKPFVKWAGGKRQLLPELLKRVPPKFGRYFEPFVGGGALFFTLAAQGGIEAALGDANVALMRTYRAVRDDVERVILLLREHKLAHSEEHYYTQRVLGFNNDDGAEARFIYLNRTGFNGLYRVNRLGRFNVPYGRYTNPTICDADNLRACSRALRGVRLAEGSDFEWIGWSDTFGAAKRDFVYFDPPYWPASGTADFTAYTADGFGPKEQTRLRDTALRLKARGVHVMLSNADVEPVRKLYAKGFKIERVEARRNINSRADRRGAVGEVIIT